MLDKFNKWWNNLSEENKQVLKIAALVIGCGFLFYKHGYKQCERDLIKGIILYEKGRI